jgi:hypothetical protein
VISQHLVAVCGMSDEEIDGEAYLGLTEAIMVNQLHLKAGQLIKIKKYLDTFIAPVSVLNISI